MMADFERAIRSIELMAAKNPEEIAYIRGKHDGLDRGRKQAVVIFIIAVVFMKMFGWV